MGVGFMYISPLPAQCSRILAEVHREFSLTLYLRNLKVSHSDVAEDSSLLRFNNNNNNNNNNNIQYTSPSGLVIWQRNLEYYSKGRQKNNSSRDEIHEKNSRIHLGQITKQMHKL